jgi:hypothetical protein
LNYFLSINIIILNLLFFENNFKKKLLGVTQNDIVMAEKWQKYEPSFSFHEFEKFLNKKNIDVFEIDEKANIIDKECVMMEQKVKKIMDMELDKRMERFNIDKYIKRGQLNPFTKENYKVCCLGSHYEAIKMVKKGDYSLISVSWNPIQN